MVPAMPPIRERTRRYVMTETTLTTSANDTS
jgi:hypothetical protein